jgi:hypothetical protein
MVMGGYGTMAVINHGSAFHVKRSDSALALIPDVLQWLHAFLCIVSNPVHQLRHRMVLEILDGAALQYRFYFGRRFDFRIKPLGVSHGLEDHWHTVVDGFYRVAGIHGDDRAGPVGGCFPESLLVHPVFIQPRERERFTARQMEIAGLFVSLRFVPLVKAVSGDKAPALLERSPESRFHGYGFYAGVDHPRAD